MAHLYGLMLLTLHMQREDSQKKVMGSTKECDWTALGVFLLQTTIELVPLPIPTLTITHCLVIQATSEVFRLVVRKILKWTDACAQTPSVFCAL